MSERLTKRDWKTDDEGHTQAYRKLAEYEDLEEQGLHVKLPCKVGTKVYFVTDRSTKLEIIETVIEKIGIKKSGLFFKMSCNSLYETSSKAIGKNVFFTREEAEKRLEELKK